MGAIFALVTALLFALSNVYNRKAARNMSGTEAISFSLGLNALIFFPLSLVAKAFSNQPWPDLTTMLVYVMSGVVGMYLGRWGLFVTISLLGPSRASALKNLGPVFTVVLAFFVFGRFPSGWPLVGIAAVMLGIWFLSRESEDKRAQAYSGLTASGRSPWALGLGVGVATAFTFAAADILRTIAMQRLPDPILATGVASLGGWVAWILVLAVRGELVGMYRRVIGITDRGLILATLFAGAGQVTNFFAVQLLFVPYVSALIATAPLMTATSSYLILKDDERFSLSFGTGTALMITGAVFIGWFG